jgi:ferric-dicitrate binding protein FerR (iron transport regulator)
MTGLGNDAQVRVITEQVADAVITRFFSMHPELSKPVKQDWPPPLKWASAIIAALFTAATIGMAFWVVNTLSSLQDTVTRIDERQKLSDPALSKRFDDIERRVGVLEGFHRGGGE